MESQHRDPKCLNCSTVTQGKFCHECGQKTTTHRITFSHFITHDLVHGVWHLDKGLLYTLKEAVLRPGYMAMHYIKGSRVKYYNVFYLSLLVIGLNVLLSQLLNGHTTTHNGEEVKGMVINEDSVDLSYYVREYFKLLLFLLVPFFAFAGTRSFKKLNLNFAEHVIIGGHLLLTGTIWAVVFTLVLQTDYIFPVHVHNYIVYAILCVLLLLPLRIYYQATKAHEQLLRFILHILLWYFWFIFQVALVMVMIALVTGKNNINL